MAWVAGVFGNFSGLPDIEVLDGREVGPSDVLGCPNPPLYRFAVEGGAFAIPSGDASQSRFS